MATKYTITVPELSLIALMGPSSAGKSTFAARYFKPTEILSSDFFRAMISDNENDQSVTREAFSLLYAAADQRLTHGRLTVIDATNIQENARRTIIDQARKQNVQAIAIVLNLPESVLQERNRLRSDRNLPPRVIRDHVLLTRKSLRFLRREGFRYVYEITSPEQLDNIEIIREKLKPDRRDDHGPFDIIGDIHGCSAELEALLTRLGYQLTDHGYAHPDGRKAAFLGDFCDRGPQNIKVLRIVMDMVKAGNAISVPGNHDIKLLKYLSGRNITMTHGMDRTAAEFEACDSAFRDEVRTFLDSLVSHYVLDDGKLAIAHAGLRDTWLGRSTSQVRDFCLYGETTGESDAFGMPIHLDWASEYRSDTLMVFGHTAGKEVRFAGNTRCIDTGCVYGGKLTAMRYPEREFVSVDAACTYYAPERPLSETEGTETNRGDIGDLLTAESVTGKLHLTTSLLPVIDISENNTAAAFETMSRYAADPHWLIYLPPTMSPCETSNLEDYLEHPLQAFEYYRTNSIRQVVCEKKHMGSRAVIVLSRTPEAAAARFGVADGTRGIIYTRTGRRFFEDAQIEECLLERIGKALTDSGFWDDFCTDWVCLDTELMPWSEKAQSLIRSMYAATGRAGLSGLDGAVQALEAANRRSSLPEAVSDTVSGQNADLAALLTRYQQKRDDLTHYIQAYREYCWTVRTVDDIRIAPFHLLSCEGNVFSDRTHVWHMETLRKYLTDSDDPILMATPYLCVDTEDENSCAAGVTWWLNLTGEGGEGMVVKPETFIAQKESRILQPAIKCRGREYLRIIYGPEYLEPDHLVRLKKRSLSRKRTLALREFSLGMESLARFVRKEPLYKIHECVFGVLALESEPVDPRL